MVDLAVLERAVLHQRVHFIALLLLLSMTTLVMVGLVVHGLGLEENALVLQRVWVKAVVLVALELEETELSQYVREVIAVVVMKN